MSELSGLSSHLKIKVRRENSYQLVRTMNIVFLCKGLLYQLSDTSLRDYFFCFFFSTYHLSQHHFFFSRGELYHRHAGLFRLLTFLITHSVLLSAELPSPPSALRLHQRDLSSTLSSSAIVSFGK